MGVIQSFAPGYIEAPAQSEAVKFVAADDPTLAHMLQITLEASATLLTSAAGTLQTPDLLAQVLPATVTAGILKNTSFSAATTLSGAMTGIALDLLTNITLNAKSS